MRIITAEEKAKKRKEIEDFLQAYKGPVQSYGDRFDWRPMCVKNCPIREIYNHEEGEDCLRDPEEVWRLPAAMIILKPEVAKAYMASEAAKAEEAKWWKEQSDWICTDEHCPIPFTHARGEVCRTNPEVLFPPEPEPPSSEATEEITDDWDNWPKDN
jgi:hypothetical protein